jgi:hypothetical protein
MAHYELGNDAIIESLIKSVFRFMSRMENLTVVEEEMFSFLRKNFHLSAIKLKPSLEIFLQKIKQFEKTDSKQELLPIWISSVGLKSKVAYEKPMGTIVREKYLHSKHR